MPDPMTTPIEGTTPRPALASTERAAGEPTALAVETVFISRVEHFPKRWKNEAITALQDSFADFVARSKDPSDAR